jgi:hypothetical protein
MEDFVCAQKRKSENFLKTLFVCLILGVGFWVSVICAFSP